MASDEFPWPPMTVVPANKDPVDGVASEDVFVDKESGIWVRLFLPTDAQLQRDGASDAVPAKPLVPVVIFVPGGGFVICSPDVDFYDSFARTLAKEAQVIVVSVNYRKAPEHKYPTAYDDTFAVLEWLRTEHSKHLPPYADISSCILLGDSAGANVVHHVGVRAYEHAQELEPLSVVYNILIVPFVGGEERTPAELTVKSTILPVEVSDALWKAFLPEGANRDHPACNVFGPGSQNLSLYALPRRLVVVAQNDVCRDWGTRYADGINESGNSAWVELFEGAGHDFHVNDKEAQKRLMEMLQVYIERAIVGF